MERTIYSIRRILSSFQLYDKTINNNDKSVFVSVSQCIFIQYMIEKSMLQRTTTNQRNSIRLTKVPIPKGLEKMSICLALYI